MQPIPLDAASMRPLKTEDVAAICRVCPDTVRIWRADGKIKGFRPAGTLKWLYWPGDVETFLRSEAYTETLPAGSAPKAVAS